MLNDNVKSPGGRKTKVPMPGRVGAWTVLDQLERRKCGFYRLCECDCGVRKFVKETSLRYGFSKSCGQKCEFYALKIDITGKRYGMLVAVSRTTEKKGNNYKWLCKCDCGNTSTVPTDSLNAGMTTSCGCKLTKHGFAKKNRRLQVYTTWAGIKQRCYNRKSNSYLYYGAIGITMYSLWHEFKPFFDYVGHPPSPEHSIDRINPFGNYEPGNVRWATAKEQMNNTRKKYTAKTKLHETELN